MPTGTGETLRERKEEVGREPLFFRPISFRTDAPAGTLGERLRLLREARGVTVESLGRALSVSLHYIRALESGDFGAFPAKVYALGFLKKILSALSAGDTDAYLATFHQEWQEELRSGRTPAVLARRHLAVFYLTPARLGIGLFALLVAIVAGALGTRLISFVGSPELTLEAPAEGATRTSTVVPIRGKTEKESQLTVNGREITIDPTGSFSEEIELPAGVHILEFTVRNRFDRQTRITRLVVVE